VYDYKQYAEVVGAALAYEELGGSKECVSTIKSGVAQLASLVRSTQPQGTDPKIPMALRPCAPISTELDLAQYESNVFGNFQGAVQYNGEQTSAPTVKMVCAAITAGTDSSTDGALERLASATALFTDPTAPFNETCLRQNFTAAMTELANATFSGRGCNTHCSSDRQWIWQSCNEFGFFQTTSAPSSSNPFSALASLGIRNAGGAICEAAYDMKGYAKPNTKCANTNYGNRNYHGDHATLVNGNMDPWHSLGIVNKTDPFFQSCGDGGSECSPQYVGSSSSIVTIDGTAHCRDMYKVCPHNRLQMLTLTCTLLAVCTSRIFLHRLRFAATPLPWDRAGRQFAPTTRRPLYGLMGLSPPMSRATCSAGSRGGHTHILICLRICTAIAQHDQA
jgi:hypothetical protein